MNQPVHLPTTSPETASALQRASLVPAPAYTIMSAANASADMPLPWPLVYETGTGRIIHGRFDSSHLLGYRDPADPFGEITYPVPFAADFDPTHMVPVYKDRHRGGVPFEVTGETCSGERAYGADIDPDQLAATIEKLDHDMQPYRAAYDRITYPDPADRLAASL